MENLENFRPVEAARYLRISISQLWNLIKAGEIKNVKLSKQVTIIRRSEIEAFIDRAAEVA